jgi:hypothetical protein
LAQPPLCDSPRRSEGNGRERVPVRTPRDAPRCPKASRLSQLHRRRGSHGQLLGAVARKQIPPCQGIASKTSLLAASEPVKRFFRSFFRSGFFWGWPGPPAGHPCPLRPAMSRSGLMQAVVAATEAAARRLCHAEEPSTLRRLQTVSASLHPGSGGAQCSGRLLNLKKKKRSKKKEHSLASLLERKNLEFQERIYPLLLAGGCLTRRSFASIPRRIAGISLPAARAARCSMLRR